MLDLRSFCAAELPEGSMRPAPTGQVNLKSLVRRLRVTIAQTWAMAACAMIFFVVLAYKTVNETRTMTDRVALEIIRLLLLCADSLRCRADGRSWAYVVPVSVVAVLMLYRSVAFAKPR